MSDKGSGTLVSTDFPSDPLALTWTQDPEDFKARLPVPGRPCSFSLGPPLGEVCRGLGPEGQAMPRGAFEALSADSQSGRRASAQGTQHRWRVGAGGG